LKSLISVKADDSVLNPTKLIDSKEIDQELNNNLRQSQVSKQIKSSFNSGNKSAEKLSG
jgi:hypothetical protein